MDEELARETVEETQLGNYEGKFKKISVKTRATLMDIIHDKSVGIIDEDRERNLIKIAKPVGVIGALSPSTNPEATPVRSDERRGGNDGGSKCRSRWSPERAKKKTK